MTLVEVMVAIVVVLIMALVVAESLRNSIEFQTLLEERDQTTRQARVALSKMRRDIQLAYLTPHQAAADNYVTVLAGLDENPDRIYLATLAHQRIYRDSRECDQAEITVWADESPKERGPGMVLYHRESQRVDHEPDEGGVVYPLAYHVRSFNLRYLDPQSNDWLDEWDTRNSDPGYRLPRAVEIALVLIAPDPEDPKGAVDIPFLSTVLLQFGGRIGNPDNPLLANAGIMGNVDGLTGSNLPQLGSGGSRGVIPGGRGRGGSSGTGRNIPTPQGAIQRGSGGGRDSINPGDVLRELSQGGRR